VHRPTQVSSPDREAAAQASRRNGVIAHRELVAAGLGKDAIGHRLRTGRLFPMHRGVYLLGHTAAPPLAWESAAILACGHGALVSHESAGHLWELLPRPRPSRRRPHELSERHDVDVTIAGRDCGQRPGIRLHRVAAFDTRDARTIHGIPITAPARTILDLAPHLKARELEQAVAEGYARGLVSRSGLAAQLARYPHRRGSRRLRRIIEGDAAPARTRSVAEERVLELVRAAGLPPPEANARVGPYEVDFVWRDRRLIVEVDGYAFHSTRPKFERDRERDASLVNQGWRVIRVTWRQVRDRPEKTVALLRDALRGGSGS
jgi:very-short-patch-repair endonuclease